MADASYDVVVIGGGHNALICAGYLAMNELSVAVFEREHELGGGACSDEVPMPGFLSNTCATSTRFHSHPCYNDFKLAEKGLDLVFPDCGQGAAFPDGTSITTYPTNIVVDKMTGRTKFSEENVEKTLKSIAKVSERDAETARFIFEKHHMQWGAALAEVIYNPPKPWGKRDAVERLMDDPDSGFEPVHGVMTVEQLAHDLWESPEMQCFFMRRMTMTCGDCAEDVPGPIAALQGFTIVLTIAANSIPIGATHSIVHALQKHLSGLGGKFFVHHEVDKVLVESGTAKGIRLTDGTEIEARKVVLSGVDIDQTVNRFLGPDYISRKIAKRARNVKSDTACVFWTNVALHELPKYTAEDRDPDFALCFSKSLVPKDPDYMGSKHKPEIWVYGIPKKLGFATFEDTRWDKTKAPEGKHNVVVEQYAPPARFWAEQEWLKLKQQFANEMIRQWQWYAPNMTKDNVIGVYIQSPYDTQRRNLTLRGGCQFFEDQIVSQMHRFRPIPELSGYRMPVKNMYLCSAAAHHGGAVRGTPGYNCYKVIQQDFGLRKIWEEFGRSY